MKILFYDTGDVRGELNEPIGIELLAAHLVKSFGEQVTVDQKWFNFNNDTLEPLQYDIIGVSIHINGLDVFDNLYRMCKQCGFQGQIVSGNSIATFAYEQLLEKYPDILCMIGEGEDAWIKLVEGYIEGSTDFSGIPNLAYLHHDKLVVTPRVVCDMEKYISPLRAFNKQLKQNHGIARVEASRGCSWNQCTFCGASHKYNQTGWRPIAIATVLQQLEELSAAGLMSVYFCDEDFIGDDRTRFAELVEGIQERMEQNVISPKMRFFISVKPTDLAIPKNMETIKRFAGCGLKEVFVGLESGCEAQIKRYNKCTNVKTNALAVNKIRELEKYGLSTDIGFIFFDYRMTPDDVEENIRFIEDNKLDSLVSSLIKPMRIQPYTEILKQTKEVQNNELLLDDLMYKYHFADDTVEQIYRTYSDLDLGTIAVKIQTAYRRELSSEAERKMVEKCLIELRSLQFLALKTIAMCYIRKEIDEEQLKDRLNAVLSQAAKLSP